MRECGTPVTDVITNAFSIIQSSLPFMANVLFEIIGHRGVVVHIHYVEVGMGLPTKYPI